MRLGAWSAAWLAAAAWTVVAAALAGCMPTGTASKASGEKSERPSAGDAAPPAVPIQLTAGAVSIACGPTAHAPASLRREDREVVGCAVSRRGGLPLGTADVALSKLEFVLAGGGRAAPDATEEAPETGPWHIYARLVEGAFATVTRIEALASIGGAAAVELTNEGVERFDPEGLRPPVPAPVAPAAPTAR